MNGFMDKEGAEQFEAMRQHEAKNGPFYPQPVTQPKEMEMALIPENTVTQADLTEWYRLQEELKRIKASEMLLRIKIYKGLFYEPVEGTNSLPLEGGWVIKAKRTIQRDIDLAALTVNATLNPDTNTSRLSEAGIVPESLVTWKPSLVLKAYKLLTAEQMEIFNECLVIKDGSPAIEIVLPAKAAKAAEAAQ